MNEHHGSLGTVTVLALCSFLACGALAGGQQAALPPGTSAAPASDHFQVIVSGVVALLVAVIPVLIKKVWGTAHKVDRTESKVDQLDVLKLGLLKPEILELIRRQGGLLTRADLVKGGDIESAAAIVELRISIAILDERLKPRAMTDNDVQKLLASLNSLKPVGA